MDDARVVVEVTPDMAREWLATSTQQRFDDVRLARLRKAITSGGWHPSRQVSPVAIRAGVLVNGNHRLRAVVDTGATVPMWVTQQKGAAAMSEVTLYHPEIDATVTVNARQAAVMRDSGWVDAQEVTEADVGGSPPENETPDYEEE